MFLAFGSLTSPQECAHIIGSVRCKKDGGWQQLQCLETGRGMSAWCVSRELAKAKGRPAQSRAEGQRSGREKTTGEKDKEGKGQRWKREGKGDSYEEQPLKERIRVRREKKVNKLWEVRQGS